MGNLGLYFLPVAMLFSTNALVQAADLTKAEKAKYKDIIQEELMYPRPCTLRLPFYIRKAGKETNPYVLGLVDSLTKNKVLIVKQNKLQYNIYPGPNMTDVVHAHVNLAYDITHINLTLGTYKIKVEDIEEKDGLVQIRGYRYVTSKTRIFHQVVEALPEKMVKAYSNKTVIWALTRNEDNSYNVEETSSPN